MATAVHRHQGGDSSSCRMAVASVVPDCADDTNDLGFELVDTAEVTAAMSMAAGSSSSSGGADVQHKQGMKGTSKASNDKEGCTIC